LHGIGGHGARWQSMAEKQLAEFRVLAPDLRGHGRSEPHPPWTLEQHAADLLSVIDAYSLASLSVVGHSFGAAVALHLSRLAPQRVGSLVLLDPVVGVDPAIALQRAEDEHRVFADRAEAEAAQRVDWPGVSEEVIAAELDAHLEQDPGGWRFRYRPPAVTTAWSEMARAAMLPNEGTPTLLVPALRENYVHPEFVRACQFVLGDDFEVFGLNAGHMLYLERQADIGELITEFIHRH
jgi:lipase